MNDNLQIQNLTKKYNSKEVLKNINVSFDLHKIHGIIGRNGAGKSTFFECLCGLTKYKGKINFTNLEGLPNKSIAYLPTLPFFYPKITGKEYLAFIKKIVVQKETNKLNRLEEIFNLPLDKYVENYSTGMKKKLSFLGLLLLDKPIYILDEPFNGVDLDGVEMIKHIIKKLKEKGCTIFISSHIISSLTDICDDVYYLENGGFSEKYFKQDFDKLISKIYNSFDEKISDIFQ